MSQIMRPTLVSPSRHGISWYVFGSGIATMSDSSMALNPVIDEPSKPIPSSSASSISLGVTAKLFRCPSMSVNQSNTNSTPSSSIRFSTSLRALGSLVARFGVSTCVTASPPESERPSVLRLGRDGQCLQLGLGPTVPKCPRVEAERRSEDERARRQRGADPPDVADSAENGTAHRLTDGVRLSGHRKDSGPDARVGDLLVDPDRPERAGQIVDEEHRQESDDRDRSRGRQREDEKAEDHDCRRRREQLRDAGGPLAFEPSHQAADGEEAEEHRDD